jgi:hypothetical protein
LPRSSFRVRHRWNPAVEAADDVIDTLISPDLPVEGIHYQIHTIDFVLGRQKVILDAVGLVPDAWKPRRWS